MACWSHLRTRSFICNMHILYFQWLAQLVQSTRLSPACNLKVPLLLWFPLLSEGVMCCLQHCLSLCNSVLNNRQGQVKGIWVGVEQKLEEWNEEADFLEIYMGLSLISFERQNMKGDNVDWLLCYLHKHLMDIIILLHHNMIGWKLSMIRSANICVVMCGNLDRTLNLGVSNWVIHVSSFLSYDFNKIWHFQLWSIC